MQLKIEDAGTNCNNVNCPCIDWVCFETSFGSTQGEENAAKLKCCPFLHAINASVVIEFGSASEARLHTNQNF